MDINKEIISLLRQRNEQGIALIYDNYSHALLGISVRIVNDQQLAENVLQKAMVKIWKNFDQYDHSKGALFTWMATIVRNLSLDQQKSKLHKQSKKTGALENVVYQMETRRINTAKIDTTRLLSGLDEKYRLVLEYLYLKGYTQRELSEEKDIPLGTIKTRLKKAIDIIRHNLQSEGGLTISILLFTLILSIA